MASTSGDTINIWDVESGRVKHVVEHRDKVRDMAFSPDGTLLASGVDDKKLKIWNVETGHLDQDISEDQAVTALSFSPDGRWLASSVTKIIKLRSIEKWAVAHSLAHEDPVQSLYFSLDGKRLASQTEDRSITLWMAPSWEKPNATITVEPTEEATAFSPDLHYVAVAHTDGTITLRKL